MLVSSSYISNLYAFGRTSYVKKRTITTCRYCPLISYDVLARANKEYIKLRPTLQQLFICT